MSIIAIDVHDINPSDLSWEAPLAAGGKGLWAALPQEEIADVHLCAYLDGCVVGTIAPQ